MIPKETTCSNSKCIAKGKCLRYKSFLRETKSNPVKFAGTKKKPCTNYISL